MYDLKEAPIIKTKRLLLRPISLEDATNLEYLLHPDIQKNNEPFMPRNLNDLPQHIERIPHGLLL